MSTDVREEMPVEDLVEEARDGLIGGRQLLAVQTFDIARLTTYPVPIVPGTFVAVSGTGPKGDSNGSGKTSFLASVSLLLGEAQWRLAADGGRYAAGLLFKPDAAGVAAESSYRAADYGYIVGVFAEPVPSGMSAEAATEYLQANAITVWLRLSATPKYIRVRWTRGLHVAYATTEQARFADADRLWNELPGLNELGPQKMASVLYGEAPRCMAYLDTTLRPSAPSLLSQQMTEMTPERIGESLIALTGREGLLDKEQEHRRVLAEQQIGLREAQQFDTNRRLDEQYELDGVRGRNKARALLRDGERLWRLHEARGYLNALEDAAAKDKAVTDAQAALDEATEARDAAQAAWEQARKAGDLDQGAEAAQTAAKAAEARLLEARDAAGMVRSELARLAEDRNRLLAIRAGWTGTPVEDLEARQATAREQAENAAADRVTATRAVEAAEQAVAQAQAGGGGPAGRALAALTAAGIPAAVLLDEITLTKKARLAWEPRLYAHRHAVVVGPEQEAAALAALADQPGAALVIADGPLETKATGLPTGVKTTLPIGRFLAALAARAGHDGAPERATDAALGESTIGGFTREIAGRAARIGAAEADLTQAREALAAAQAAERRARLALEEVSADLAAGRAEADLDRLTGPETALHAQLGTREQEIARLTSEAETARAAYLEIAAKKIAHDTEVRLAQTGYEATEREVRRLTAVLAERTEDRRHVPVDLWQARWADTPEAAHELLADQPEELRQLKQGTYRSRAADALKDALAAYEAGVTALPPLLAEAKERRRQLIEGEPGVAGATVDFTSIAAPLRDLLDSVEDRDRVTEDKIVRDQARRTEEIEATRVEVEKLTVDLRTTQDMVATSLLTALKRISDALDTLNKGRKGFGAELKVEHEPPDSPAVPWKWKVTPRWRRSPNGPMVSYREVANGAQVKVFAIQLVLAALLAADGAPGRVLVLDELGNSLGDANRRDVLKDLHQVAQQMNLTILGTCQDSVIRDAAEECGEVLWFSHKAATDVFNQPTRAWGQDPGGRRVHLVADWLRAGRELG